MNYAEFLEAVAKRAGLPPTEAANVIRATLETLAERISGGEASDLATQLPEELRGYLSKEDEFGERLDLAEFVHEVRARAGVGMISEPLEGCPSPYWRPCVMR